MDGERRGRGGESGGREGCVKDEKERGGDWVEDWEECAGGTAREGG